MSRRFGTRGRRGGDWSGAPGTLPPQSSALSLWLDPASGVSASGGFVDSWSSRVGTATFTGTTTTRPAYAGTYLEFDGTDDFLTRTADSQSHPDSVTSFTWGAWLWRTLAASDRVAYSSVPLFTGSGGILVQDGVASRQYYANNAGTWNVGSVLGLGSWVFRSIVYDSTLSLGSRLAVYEGASPSAVALVTPGAETSVGATGAAAGSSDIGRDAGLGRFFGGRVGSMYLYPSVKLTLAELQALAAVRQP